MGLKTGVYLHPIRFETEIRPPLSRRKSTHLRSNYPQRIGIISADSLELNCESWIVECSWKEVQLFQELKLNVGKL